MYSEEEYLKHIKILSWKLLIDTASCKMPIRITKVARLLEFQDILDYQESRWDNAKVLCAGILDRYGLNHSGIARKQLAVMLLCPMCVVRQCNIRYPEEITVLADIPYKESVQCFAHLSVSSRRGVSSQEAKILRQFDDFIFDYNKARDTHFTL